MEVRPNADPITVFPVIAVFSPATPLTEKSIEFRVCLNWVSSLSSSSVKVSTPLRPILLEGATHGSEVTPIAFSQEIFPSAENLPKFVVSGPMGSVSLPVLDQLYPHYQAEFPFRLDLLFYFLCDLDNCATNELLIDVEIPFAELLCLFCSILLILFKRNRGIVFVENVCAAASDVVKGGAVHQTCRSFEEGTIEAGSTLPPEGEIK